MVYLQSQNRVQPEVIKLMLSAYFLGEWQEAYDEGTNSEVPSVPGLEEQLEGEIEIYEESCLDGSYCYHLMGEAFVSKNAMRHVAALLGCKAIGSFEL